MTTTENNDDNARPPYTNTLIDATSPYLLQHAHNPVDWQQWRPDVLKAAAAADKPLIISIGYSACHWCHVMEKETFMDEQAAAYMNAHFVAIKVDREQRPDLDQIYLKAAELLNGSAGWPLNVFALPDGRPFYATTYRPQKNWIHLMQQINDLWRNQRDQVEQQAADLTRGIAVAPSLSEGSTETDRAKLLATYEQAWKNLKPLLDRENGGLVGSMKFPMPKVWEFALQYFYFTKDPEVMAYLSTTLYKMITGGLYDQLGGGFSRYTVDPHWHVPHFEKMLYDNAQLVSLFANAYRLTGDAEFKRIVDHTLEFIQREMSDEQGGCYSAINADSEGEEGKYYVWRAAEIEQHVLKEKAALFMGYFQVTEAGNWEQGRNVLHRVGLERTYLEQQKDPYAAKVLLDEARESLMSLRSRRPRPSTDDKILTSWNGLMIKAYADAYRMNGDKMDLIKALFHSARIDQKLRNKGHRLYSTYRAGQSEGEGTLEDYAFLAEAYLQLYTVTFKSQWLQKAHHLLQYVHAHFQDPDSSLYFSTADNVKDLITRPIKIVDDALPSGNSVMAHLWFRLGHYYDKQAYLDRAAHMYHQVADQMVQHPAYFANWALLGGLLSHGLKEMVVAGPFAQRRSMVLQRHYMADVLYAGGIREELPLLQGRVDRTQTRYFICQDKTCQPPFTDPVAVLEQFGLNDPAS